MTKQNSLGFNIKLQLLDHHITGLKCSKQFSWYMLDEKASATKITYDYFKQNFTDFSTFCEVGFDDYVKAVNAVDIWLQDDKYFEFGKVLLTMISKSFEINDLMFDIQNRNYKFYLIEKSILFIDKKENNIKLDEEVYFLKKDYMKQDEKNDTFENTRATYITNMLTDDKDKLTVKYINYKGILTYNMGNISILANRFLTANADVDFFMDINRKGRVSLRSNDKLDVASLASLLSDGGGHKNAAGASFNDFRETSFYEDINSFVQNKLDAV